MKEEDIKPGIFCYNYKKVNKLYQIVGIAKTADISNNEKYNRVPDFRAADVEDKEYSYACFVLPFQEIVIGVKERELRDERCIQRVISSIKKQLTPDERYVIYNTLTFMDWDEPRIWARKLDDFVSDVELYGQIVERFTEV